MRRMKWKSLVCALLALSLLICPALAANVLDAPANGCVLDVAGVLQSDTIEHMVAQNKKLSDATGGAIVVVTVDFLNGKEIDDYALELFNAWGVGDEKKDNGILILLAIGEEDYWVLQGTGLQSALPASALGEYTWNYLENDFANQRYDEGVHKLFDALYAWFEDYYASDFVPQATQPPIAGVPVQPPAGSSAGGAGSVGIMVAILVVVLLLVVAVLVSSGHLRRRRYGYSGAYYSRPVYFWRPWRRRAPRPPRPPRQPRPPMSSGGGFGGFGGLGGLGGGASRGGGAGRSSGFTRRSSGGGFRASGGGRSFGGGRSRGGGAGRGR